MSNFHILNPAHLFPLLVIAAGAAGLFRLTTLVASAPEENTGRSQLEQVLPDMQSSAGNAYGCLYTLDGEPMIDHYALGLVHNPETGEREQTILRNVSRTSLHNLYIPTDPSYASAVGVMNYNANGLLQNLSPILSSNAEFVNRREALGDSVITTLVSAGQKAAYEELKVFSDKAKFSSISVVGGDGAILVNVGSNCDAILNYDQRLFQYYLSETANDDNVPQPRKQDRVYNDFGTGRVTVWNGEQIRCEDAECVGSVFKIVTARILQQNDSLFTDEFSVYNDSFTDVAEVDFGTGEPPIGNHDRNRVSYPRQISLAQALMYSSNTYFLRHVQAMGMDKYLEQLSTWFRLDYNLNADSHQIPAMPFDNPDGVLRFEEKITYGQEAILTTVRLASVVSQAISGEAYDLFSVAEVRTPDNEVIFHHVPQGEIEELHMDVDMHNDILVNGLKRTFEYYVTCCPDEFAEFSDTLLNSGRILAKSGTADKASTTENHTMVVSILDEQREHIVMTAAIAVNEMDISYGNDLVNEGAMAARLLRVAEALGVISDAG